MSASCNFDEAFYPDEPINPVGSVYYQFANLFFLLAALYTDILLIRGSLVLGNLMILIQAALGWPFYPCWTNAPWVSLDTLVWSFLSLLFHSLAVLRLL